MEIVVLNRDEIDALLRNAAAMAVAELRDDLERTRTPELMTKEQLAVYLGCHITSIRRHIKNGMPLEKLGEHLRFRKADVDLWLRGQANGR